MPDLLTISPASAFGGIFVGFIVLIVPWAVIRNRASALSMAWIPLGDRFYPMLIPQVFLGLIAVATGLANDIEMFPHRSPPLPGILAGALFLAVSVAVIKPHWRQSIEEGKPAWRLFAPTNRRERRLWVVLSLSAGVGEELVWRGVLPALIVAWTGSLAGAVLISVTSFALAHAIQGPKSVFAIAAIAAAFHALVFVSGSLYVGMVVHFVYDVVAGFTYARFARELGRLAPAD